MPHDIAIDIRGLSKSFDGAVAVDNVIFTVRVGEVFGFMGHNGAGKTTNATDAARPLATDQG